MFDRPRSKRDPVHWEGSGVPQKRKKQTSYGQNGGPIDREGVAYRKTDETDLCWSATAERGSCSSRGCGVPQNRTPQDIVHLHRQHPPASTGSLRPPPPFTDSCSSSLHRALHHRLLFTHPSTGTPLSSTVHPALHATGSCSTTPPRAPLHRLLFIQPSTTPRGPVHPEATPPLTVHPTPPPPPQRSLFIQSIGFS